MQPTFDPRAVPVPQGPPTQLARTTKRVAAPIALLIVTGVVAAAATVLLTAGGRPDVVVFAAIVAGLASFGVVAFYLWLDRWEPEPPRLLLLGWLWGGGIAVALALIVGWIVPSGEFAGAVIQAPVVEELGKAAFLVIMITGVRRREMNTLVDCLVYAGLVGAGFEFVENLAYIAGSDNLGEGIGTAISRMITPFGHPLYASMTAIGVYFSLTRRSTAAKIGAIALGYLGAVLIHAIWNGVGLPSILFFIPLLAGMAVLAVLARRRELRILHAQLPGIVSSGLISGTEASWLSSMKARRAWVKNAKQHGKPAGKAAALLAAEVTELAFIRDRVDRGFGSAETAQRYDELAAAIAASPRAPQPPAPPPAPPALPPGPPGPMNTAPTWSPIPGAYGPGPQSPGAPGSWPS